MTVTPVQDARGEITHFIAIKQDISERKRAEEALHEARDELARANAALERKVAERTAQLVEANGNLQTFAYTAAHDLRSPLRSIRNFSGMVLEDYGAQLGADGRSLLERVTASADQMNRLLNDLLDYSKMSQAELKLEPVSLRQAIGEALALLDADIRGKNAVVTVAEPLPEVIGNEATVVLLINNLVSNALKFVSPGVQPQIRIGTEYRRQETGDRRQEEPATQHATRTTIPHSAPRTVRIWVQDNGIGIAREDLEKLFSAFQRLYGRQVYPGTGLGLAIVRKGAERMGGQVGVESEPGKGSRFWIELRAAAQP
jgi:signal transduction histidine kinase